MALRDMQDDTIKAFKSDDGTADSAKLYQEPPSSLSSVGDEASQPTYLGPFAASGVQNSIY